MSDLKIVNEWLKKERTTGQWKKAEEKKRKEERKLEHSIIIKRKGEKRTFLGIIDSALIEKKNPQKTKKNPEHSFKLCGL